MIKIVYGSPVSVASPPDYARVQARAHFRVDIDETGPVRREQPLVRVYGEYVGLNRLGIESKRAYALGAIHVKENSTAAQKLSYLSYRRRVAVRIIDGAERHHPGPVRDSVKESFRLGLDKLDPA